MAGDAYASGIHPSFGEDKIDPQAPAMNPSPVFPSPSLVLFSTTIAVAAVTTALPSSRRSSSPR
ncbi:hypothetical protein CFC21_036665 [Triticum aestivum]|uniref:Uncharacterized protein n=4 Tax=Triticum TaxID=4564 RepID=A0A9R0RVD1_TRITD|nr:hypothetical protein TRIUR3_28747 [Triticum urartu]KAF7024299.1 hypothetical protein CFC21_036665 [Triticum aestivum]VAH65206.1 unnamed protein product [Triticum turgidum subsp. durum]